MKFIIIISLLIFNFQIQESSASTSDAYDFSWLDPGKKYLFFKIEDFVKITSSTFH